VTNGVIIGLPFQMKQAEPQISVEGCDPGYLQCRWVPNERNHGSSQRRLPSGSIRPRKLNFWRQTQHRP